MCQTISFSSKTCRSGDNTQSGIIERYKDQPSIKLFKSKNSSLTNSLSFTPASTEEVKRPIECLDPEKVAPENDIHTNTLKQISHYFTFYMQKDAVFALISAPGAY